MTTLFFCTRRNPVSRNRAIPWAFKAFGGFPHRAGLAGVREAGVNSLSIPQPLSSSCLGLEPGKGFTATRAKDEFHLWIADSWSYLEEETSF